MNSAPKSSFPEPILWALLWAVLVGAALVFRPILPVDETRYVGVAWEMWLSGDFLVPHLNGVPYSHKPPLLFWLINAGWGVFGVNDWWPRLVAPAFGLGCVYLTSHLARRLWPASSAYLLAPLIMLG
ncbi:MAG: glycosyl transferase, partial [Rhodospirillales bacterium]|nr:glycosyl transferase [Rhodospirillales bacterium]